MQSLLTRFEDDGLFADKKLNEANFGPDSSFTTVLVSSGKKRVRMQSWHELYERSGKTFVGHHGVGGLDGRRRLELLREESAQYLSFRLIWSETRGRLMDLIPSNGELISGEPVSGRDGLSWREGPVGEVPVKQKRRE